MADDDGLVAFALNVKRCGDGDFVPLVHPLVWSGHDVHCVAVPPALYTAPEHCVHVCPLTILPATALNAVVIVLSPHAVALVCVLVNTPPSQ